MVAVEQQLEHVGAALEASDADQVLAAVTPVDDRAARGGRGVAVEEERDAAAEQERRARVCTLGDAGVAVPAESLQHEGALLTHHELRLPTPSTSSMQEAAAHAPCRGSPPP